MQYHKTIVRENNGKFVNHKLENYVLGPWLWPRPFPFLASRGSVVEKSVLGLSLGFFFLGFSALAPNVVFLDSTSGLRAIWFLRAKIKHAILARKIISSQN